MRKLIGTQPLFVAGATVVVFNKKGETLLQQRSDINKWGFPGGVMEYGESLEETAIRELYEETGLKAKDIEFVDILSGEKECFKYPNGDEIFGVNAVYTTSNVSGELSINDGESTDLKFFALNKLPFNLIEKTQYIIKIHFSQNELFFNKSEQ
ncbi:NUDIX hydrolase [Paraliobacillus zengyii]|uniref:NUDIX hydrolase n=1 Tax=Paraliobacillus zengyii TaxID=2213194 RepID=UPI0018E551DE|nr:NUDIX hydrolase [Paraliobacillus zengyii]